MNRNSKSADYDFFKHICLQDNRNVIKMNKEFFEYIKATDIVIRINDLVTPLKIRKILRIFKGVEFPIYYCLFFSVKSYNSDDN